MTKFPSTEEVKRMSQKLKRKVASKPLSPKASAVDKAKHKLCAFFIEYKKEHGLTQKDFAKILKIDEALMSKILHYQFEGFTTDRLIRYLSEVYPKLDLELNVA